MKTLKHHQKLIITIGGMLLTALIFWFYIYLPKKKQVQELKEKLNDIKLEIAKVEGTEGQKEGLDIVLARYNKELIECEKILPSKEEETLRELSILASRLGIEVLSIIPSIAETSDLPVVVEGYTVKELPISVELKTSFRVFGEYARLLQNEFPTVLQIDSFFIKKEGEKQGVSILRISLKLTIYMLYPCK